MDRLDDVPWVKKPGRLHEIAAALNSLTPISRQQAVEVPEPLVGSSSSAPAVYPDDLEPAMQQELAALADIELRYERLAGRLNRSSRPRAARDRLAQQLEARHQKEREPHVRCLAELYQRMTSVRLVSRRSI